MADAAAVRARRALVAELERLGAVRSSAVRRAFLNVPRELFVPEIAERDGLDRVYANQALMTRSGEGGRPTSSSSQPSIMADMLERLDLRPGQRVLEIGAGTGYNAALLSRLVGPHGRVTSVELQWDLAERAAKALRAGSFSVDVIVGDAQRGRFGDSPFDRIIVTASSDHVPRAWFDQLAPGGLIGIPMRIGAPGPWHQLVVTFRKVEDGLRSAAIVWGGFMHLRSADDRGGEGQPAQVSVTEMVEGRGRTLAHLIGPGLATMTAGGRRRLTALLLSQPRTRTIPTPGPANASLLPFLAMAEPQSGVLVGHVGDAGPGVGIASVDGRSLSIVVAGATDGRARVLRYGTDGASLLLDAEVARWRREGRPSFGEWRVGVSFGDPPSVRPGRRVGRHGESWITVDWATPAPGR